MEMLCIVVLGRSWDPNVLFCYMFCVRSPSILSGSESLSRVFNALPILENGYDFITRQTVIFKQRALTLFIGFI